MRHGKESGAAKRKSLISTMMEAVELVPGTVLQNRYRILSLLKHGGMCRVYLAEDKRLRSQVAVKEGYFIQEKFRQAFAQEAGLLYRLRHRVLPPVTDYFIEGPIQYLVMQLFSGRDLEELLDEKVQETGEAFAVDQVLRWADQLLDALEYLHGQPLPIIHRDIKPRNIKLTERGEIILLDFGLAKEAARVRSQAVESLPGYTHHYAPLEQIRGTGTDPRTDLYALAATIYRLLTGHLPSDALTRAAATLEHQPDPLRPAHELNGRVPEAVAAVLASALAQRPSGRPATATNMRRALREASRTVLHRDHKTTSLTNERQEESAPPSGAPGTGEIRTAEISAGTATNAGQMIASYTAGSVNESLTVAILARGRPGDARGVRITLMLFLLTIAALAYWRIDSPPGSGASTLRGDHLASIGSSISPPRPWDEVIRFYLQVVSDTGKTECAAGSDPILKGRWVKFHFEPLRRGYLYIVAPGARTSCAMFLTAQSNPAWGVKGNLLAAGDDYTFPPGQEKWIEVASDASLRTYTFIFAPEPLTQPRFLTGPADRDLTPTEETELAELRTRLGQFAQIEIRGDQSVVSIPAEGANKIPILFEVNLHKEINIRRK